MRCSWKGCEVTRPRGARYLGVALAVAAVVVAVALIRGRGESHVAARVAGTTISTGEVDLVLRHARDEAAKEGKDFPADGTPLHQALRRQALDLLIYHEELAQRATELGVELPAADLAPSAGVEVATGGADPDAGDRVFFRQSVRGAQLYRRIYDRVTRDVSVSDAELRGYLQAHPEQRHIPRAQIRRNLLDTKRNALMARWLARMKRDYATRVEYGPDFKS
jgi:hypothetical protein